MKIRMAVTAHLDPTPKDYDESNKARNRMLVVLDELMSRVQSTDVDEAVISMRLERPWNHKS